MSRRTLLGLALLAAAVVTSWTAWRNRDRDQAPPAPEQRSDYVLRDFELVMLARDGSESLRLTAPELKRRREDESADIVQPVFVMPADQGLVTEESVLQLIAYLQSLKTPEGAPGAAPAPAAPAGR